MGECREALLAFHGMLDTLVGAPSCSGVIADRTLAHAMVVFNVPAHFASFAADALRMMGSGPMRVKMVAAHGTIVTVAQGGTENSDQRLLQFSGPVISEILSRNAPLEVTGILVAPSLTGPVVEAVAAFKDAAASNTADVITDIGSTLDSAFPDNRSEVRTPYDSMMLAGASGQGLGIAVVRDSTESGWAMVVSETTTSTAAPAEMTHASLVPASSVNSLTSERLTLSALQSGSSFLVSGPVMKRVLAKGSELCVGSFSRVAASDADGSPVVTKTVLEQTMSSVALVELVMAMALQFELIKSLPDAVLAPIAVCPFRPHISVMYPLVELGSIGDAIAAGNFGGEFSRRVSVALARALFALHTEGVTHGSIKPSNVMLMEASGSKVTLMDVGINGIKTSLSTMTMSPSVSYSCPEVLNGEAVGQGSDIFGFASTVFELVSGKQAFTGINAMQVAYRIMSSTVPPTAHIHPELAALLVSCWAPAASDRPHMSEVVQHLSRFTSLEFTVAGTVGGER